MDIEKLVDLAHAYNDLGWAVQEQLGDILDNLDDVEEIEVNSNAARMIHEWAVRAERAGVEGADALVGATAELAGMR